MADEKTEQEKIAEIHRQAAEEQLDTQENPVYEENGVLVDPHGNPVDGGDKEGDDEPDATDGARKFAEENGVDLAGVQGSGAGGRITQADVQKAVSEQDSD